jgi:hypothetical protein
LPSVIFEKWIVVRAEVSRGTHSRNCTIEHAAQGDAVHITNMHTEANDASRELVHDHYDAKQRLDLYVIVSH